MAALSPFGGARVGPFAWSVAALGAACAFLAIPALGWAEDTPNRNGSSEGTPAQNPPVAAEPKPPAPGEAKTGVIHPPDVDPSMSKQVPNVDPTMAKPPKPQPPPKPEGKNEGKSPPEGQPR